MDYQAAPGVRVRNESYYVTSKRHWRNAESYTLNPAGRLINRDSYLEILHANDYTPVTGRGGLVWNIDPAVSLYVQYGTATDPPSGAPAERQPQLRPHQGQATRIRRQGRHRRAARRMERGLL